MGGGLEADLSHGAVAALSRLTASAAVAGWRPVLQVADLRHLVDGCLDPAAEIRYSVKLSDGAHLQPGRLAVSLNHLVRDGALRRGSVVRVLDFVCDCVENQGRLRSFLGTSLVVELTATIIVMQLQILQEECTLIGSLKPYEPVRKSVRFATTSTFIPNCEPYPCGGSYPAGHGIAPLAEPAVWKTIAQIKNENLGCSDEADFITVKAIISFISTKSFCYASCPLLINGTQCNMKVTGNGDGTWYCKRCDQSFENCDSVYSVHIQIQDHTGTAFAIVSQEAGNYIFGYTAKDLYAVKYEAQDHAQFADIVQGALRKESIFKMKVEAKPFSGGYRAKCTVLAAENVYPSAECHRLLGAIGEFLQEGSGSSLESFH
ncbi:hypothetical protein ACP70R_032116 [Stipagrostis hirtigluma subsp. patula]